ncbi:MAG: HDOD domain-containing protein [Spirochaetia bacterium]|nr:HDOD domain-containing protein [Spirochaetia bacterium]
MDTKALDALDFKNIKLPFQPHVLSAILRLQGDNMMNFHDLNNLIKSDQNLTTLVLKIANSSFYYRGNVVSTLETAIGMIGFQTVISFSIAASIKNAYESANYSRFRKYVWQHSIVTGIISKNLAIRLNFEKFKEEAFIAGAIHDIGKVVLNNLDRKKFIEVIQEVTDSNIAFHTIEGRQFGYNHNQLGLKCIEHWRLPDIYKLITGYHAYPEQAPQTYTKEDLWLLYLVCYSNILAKKYKFGFPTDQDKNTEAFVSETLKLSKDDISYYENTFLDELKKDPFYQFFITLI